MAAAAGIAAFIALAVACAGGALVYQGAQNEAYTPINHWISELGQLGVSEGAELFNAALMFGGGAFALFVMGMAMTSPSRLRWVFGPAGVIAGIGGIFVGVYPMNAGDAHALSAATFFLLAWVFVAVASLAFVRACEPRHPAWLALLGAVTALVTLAFLISLRVDPEARARMQSTGPIVDRPPVWIPTILEWATLLLVMTWVLLTSLAWLRQLVRESAERAS